ncbi:reverse transcriptase domain-containing protein [Tanacetum coccineum]
MRTRSSSNLVGESSPNPNTSNPKRQNRRRSKQPFSLEESPVDTMADQCTMMELLRAPTEGYAEAIVVPPILAEHFELKHSLINMMTSDPFFGLEKDNHHDHIHLVSKFINEFFPPSRTTNLRNEISNFQQRFDESFHKAWDRYKDLLRACPHHGFTELHQLDTFYNALNPTDQDSLNSAAGGNLLERSTQDVLTIIENKSKVRNSRNKSIVSQVKSSDVNSSSSSEIAKLTHAVNQQTSVVTTAMTAILKQFQATPPPASVKAVEEICVTCGGAHPYYQCLTADGNTFRDNIQGYVSAAAVNYNQGNSGYRPPSVANQIRPPDTSYQALIQQNQVVPLSELEKIKKINKLKNMMASFFQMNTTSTSGSGSQPSNTIANPKSKLKAITTRSGLVLDGPSVLMPPPFINPKEDNVDPLHPNILYPSRMHQEKQQEKDEVQIHKFWQMFKQLHINISLADALILILKYQKMLKSLLSNKEKLLELANIPLNENCSAVILKKLPEKLGDPGKFLISCGFSELKCKALADLGASINLMPLSVWKKLGLPELISTRMTLELANRTICTPAGIARDVFVSVEKFTFPADFIIVDYESDTRVPLILGRPFLRTARALIDVHGEEMILRDGEERLILNMRHDTSSYSNKPKKESINMIDIYNVSHINYLEDLLTNEKKTNHQSGNPTFSSNPDLTSPKVINPLSGNPTPILKPVTNDSFPPGNDVPVDLLLKEYADKLAHFTFPPRIDYLPFDAKYDLREIENLFNHDPIEEMDSILEDSIDKTYPDDNLVDTISKMFTDEHALDYSSPPLWDDYNDELFDLETVNDNTYDDPFDSKEEKMKESKLLIDELDPPRSSDFLPSLECDLVFYEDFFEVDALYSTNNEDKVFNSGILIHKSHFEVTNRVTPDKNVKKPTNASLILENFNPPLYGLPFHKEVPGSETLLLFSSENEEKVFNPGILTSKGVHTSLLQKLSYRDSKSFKVINIFESPMEIFPCSYGEDIRTLDVPCLHFYPP